MQSSHCGPHAHIAPAAPLSYMLGVFISSGGIPWINVIWFQRAPSRRDRLIDQLGSPSALLQLPLRPVPPASHDFAADHFLHLAGELFEAEGLGQEVDLAVAVEALAEGIFGVA